MAEKKEIKIKFAPGCFDDFEGTQEELDAFVAEIQDMLGNSEQLEKLIASGDITQISATEEELDEILAEVMEQLHASGSPDDLDDPEDEEFQAIMESIDISNLPRTKRTLH